MGEKSGVLQYYRLFVRDLPGRIEYAATFTAGSRWRIPNRNSDF